MEKKIYLMLSVFFAINPNIEAMPNIAQPPSVAEPEAGGEPGNAGETNPPQAPVEVATAPPSSKVLLNAIKKIEFDITMEAHKRLLDDYKISYDISKILVPHSFSDEVIKKATKYLKSVLYSSNVNIKEWQIAKKISNIIDEKIAGNSNTAFSIEHLKSFKKAALQEYELSLFERREFLKNALNVAAELSMWKTLYDAHRSHFEAEHADVSEKILSFFNDKDITSQCEDLYKEKVFVGGFFNVKHLECALFIDKIRSLIVPLIGCTKKEVSIGQSAQMKKFFEKVQVAFENPETMSLYFNREDGEIFLDVLAKSVDFYKTQLAQVKGSARAQEVAHFFRQPIDRESLSLSLKPIIGNDATHVSSRNPSAEVVPPSMQAGSQNTVLYGIAALGAALGLGKIFSDRVSTKPNKPVLSSEVDKKKLLLNEQEKEVVGKYLESDL